jgi:23S rRNA G2445 N2-methylase RlmL
MDYKNIINKKIDGWLVSNPPYGERLEDFDIVDIHKDIAALFAQNTQLQG